MKVVITRANDDNWYKIGEEYEVEDVPLPYGYGYYPLKSDRNTGIGLDDFEIIEPPSGRITEADKLAARIEVANTMAANLPEKTLWDEYAMAAMTGVITSASGITAESLRVRIVCHWANAMMEARKNYV
jgi:hypothetical protein